MFRYIETIDILYSANTLNMSSTVMILNLPRLVPPSRLASIKSVQMAWNIHPFRESTDDDLPETDLAAFQKLVVTLPTIFPSLQKLYLSIQGDMKRGNLFATDIIEVSESIIMEPLDDLVCRLGPKLQVCEVAVPTSLYAKRKYAATGKHLRAGWPRKGLPRQERFWRVITKASLEDGDTVSVPHRNGYWLYHGQLDQPHLFSSGMCAAMMDDTPESESE